MDKPCETCRALPPVITSGLFAGQRHMHNYCVHCSKDLCKDCLSDGRCRESKSERHEAEIED